MSTFGKVETPESFTQLNAALRGSGYKIRRIGETGTLLGLTGAELVTGSFEKVKRAALRIVF